MAANYPPTFKVTGEPQTASVVRFISPLQNPGKLNSRKELYWMARIRDSNGVENTLFINEPERKDFLTCGICADESFVIQRVGTGKFDDDNREIRVIQVTRAEGDSPTPEPRSSATGMSTSESKAVFTSTQEVTLTPSQMDGWTSGFKLNPDLRVVPTQDNGPQEVIFNRLCNGVGDEFADLAREKISRMVPAKADLTPAQAVTLAPALQATFATLVIAWKDLGYPVTPSERAHIELGGDAPVPYGD